MSQGHPYDSTEADLIGEVKYMEFIEFMNDKAINPPKVSELFKIPEGLSPAWQEFFDKVAAYHERQCKEDSRALTSLEERSWVSENQKVNEIEMLMTAIDLAMKGNEEFKKGDIHRAQLLYHASVNMFPTPDGMNNMAACSLKQNHFDWVELYTTKALDMDLFSNPVSIAKAYYRRAYARLRKANFEGAREDATSAKQSDPSQSTNFDEFLSRIEALSASVKTSEEVEKYLQKQPRPLTKCYSSLAEMANDLQNARFTGCTEIPPHVQVYIKASGTPPVF